MSDFSYDEPAVKKRKGRDLISQSVSKAGEWESSSSSAPKNKKKKIEAEWMSASSEEVGDNDDLHLLGKELFEQTTSSGPGVLKNEPVQRCEKDMVTDSRTAVNAERNHEKLESAKGADADCLPKLEEKGSATTRSYMEKVLGELKEARGQLLQWMRQELHNILCEQFGSRGVQMSFVEQNGMEVEFEEGLYRRSMAASLLNSGVVRSQFGGQGCMIGRLGFTGHGTGGQVNYRSHVGGSDSNLGKIPSSVTEGVLRAKHKGFTEGLGTVMTGQKNSPIDKVLGSSSSKCMDFGEQTRETPSLVGLQDTKIGFAGFGRRNGGDGGEGFPLQPDLHGDTGLGPHAGSGVGLRYGVQSNCNAAMVFGEQAAGSIGNGGKRKVADVRSSLVPSDTNPSNNGVGMNQGSFVRPSVNERTTDLMGMQGMQSSVALNTIQNVQQSGRNENHAVLDSRIPKFNQELHGKTFSGGIGAYRGIIGHSIGFESSTGMRSPQIMHNASGALGVQLPIAAQSSSQLFTSSSMHMPILVGMQTQAAMHNSSSMQNFLGLSMNGLAVGASASKQVFPGVYLQQNAHFHMPSGKGATMATSPQLHAVTQKRGHGVQGMDILELNT